MWFDGAYVMAMCGGDKDRATRVSSLANEEPLVVVKACVDIVREVIGEDCGDSRYSVVREGETSLCCGRYGGVRQRTSGAEDGYIGCGWGSGGHRGSEVFTSGGSDKDVVGVDSNILVERGEEEGVEDFLGDLGGSRRHGR
jgi:hypothetical protein